MAKSKSKEKTRKIGRDAETGHFKSVEAAEKDRKGSVVETILLPKKPTKDE